jgi:putative ABC transport system substrate-binding protein
MQSRVWGGRLRRRAFVGGLAGLGASATGLALLGGCGLIAGQPAAPKMPLLGSLSGQTAEGESPTREAFRQGLREQGYVEGQNIRIEFRYTEGRPERLPAVLAELLALPPDVLVAWGTSQAAAAKEATKTIPIVFQAGDPVSLGLVNSLSRPGGNLTGVSITPSGFYAKRLEMLNEAFPTISRIAFVTTADPTGPIVRELQDIAPRLGVQLQVLHMDSPDDLANTLTTAVTDHAEALMVGDNPWIFTSRSEVIQFAAQQRLPAIYFRSEYVADGGLMSYGQRILDSARRVAVYVDKVLKGANPGEIPVEQPTTFDFAVNRTALATLGLTLPSEAAAQVTAWVD